MQTASRPARRLLAVLFAAGLLILLDQSADLIATLLSRPAAPSAANWRFGVFGLAAGRTSAVVVGDVMLFASAAALGWRSMLRVLAVLHLLLAAGVAAGLGLFVLDAVQVRGAVRAESARAFSTAAVRAAAVALGAAITFAWAGVAAWRTSAGQDRSRRQGSDSILVVGAKEGREM